MNATHNTIMVALIVMVALAGCGGDSGPTGTYQSKLGPGQTFSLKFLGNDEMEVTINENGMNDSYKTNFVTKGDTIVMNIPEAKRQTGRPASMEFKRNGEAFEMTAEGMTIRFEKL